MPRVSRGMSMLHDGAYDPIVSDIGPDGGGILRVTCCSISTLTTPGASASSQAASPCRQSTRFRGRLTTRGTTRMGCYAAAVGVGTRPRKSS
jgi:hypothetical protein